MQLAGPHVFGPPADRDGAIAVLREVVKLGITHIDTSDFYGPHITNQLIKEALHPYPEQLRIVTKVGARRDEKGNWPRALAPEELRIQDVSLIGQYALQIAFQSGHATGLYTFSLLRGLCSCPECAVRRS